MTTYDDALNFLFNQRPAFERQGAGGYKPGLDTTIYLDNMFGNPHKHYRTIHVAGTNGKGSVSSLIAAVLQSQGYKVGLYTSPHFVDFTERIKVNGTPISHERVIDFVDKIRSLEMPVEPSFFELTTILAFNYFKECDVDFAVIEVGLGGRLDSTNIISPIISVITNISIDHTEFLGNTVSEIASEKAGIIKPGIPVVVGAMHEDAKIAIKNKALETGSVIKYPQNIATEVKVEFTSVESEEFGQFTCQLTGDYQRFNISTALTAISTLKQMGIEISKTAVHRGFEKVCDLTSFRGRWTVVAKKPLTICDSAHNIDGMTEAMRQLANIKCDRRHIIVGFMADKDLEHIFPLLPENATYYFTQASTPRALSATDLQKQCSSDGLKGNAYGTVIEAYEDATSNANANDVIYVGGSMYVLSEFFSYIDSLKP